MFWQLFKLNLTKINIFNQFKHSFYIIEIIKLFHIEKQNLKVQGRGSRAKMLWRDK